MNYKVEIGKSVGTDENSGNVVAMTKKPYTLGFFVLLKMVVTDLQPALEFGRCAHLIV